jgi:hypothetical protein
MIIAGYFDYAIIAILIILNIIFWKKKIKYNVGCIIGFLLFGIMLPIASQYIEVQRVKNSIGIMDNFEVLYTFFRFPLYWLIGILQSLILSFKNYKSEKV